MGRRTRTLVATTVSLVTTCSVVALGSPTASARWQVHNDADITQIIPPPASGDESLTCSNRVRAQSAWSTNVPAGEDPESVRPPSTSGAYGRLRYDVWKAPVNDPNGNFQESDPGPGVDFFDSMGNLVGPATRVSPLNYRTPARQSVPAHPVFPPVDPTTDNLYYYSLTGFTVGLSGVSRGDLLGIKPSSGGSTFINLTAVYCTTARIDVLPGASPNVIHPKVKRPLVPVRLYGSAALHVRSVVLTSVHLQDARAATDPAHLRRPLDANNDGRLDRVYFFSPAATGIRCGQASVNLTGRTTGGRHFSGANPIRAVCR
jgi:hypothetical protein